MRSSRSWSILTLLCCLLGFSPAFGDAGITYHGRLLKPNGQPVTESSVQFLIQIRTPSPSSCLMYQETQVKDLSQSQGVFSITINDGTQTQFNTEPFGLEEVFRNSGNSRTFPLGKCSGGHSITFDSTLGRQISVSFNDGTFTGWEPLPSQAINFVPSALEAVSVGGRTAKNFFRVETVGVPEDISAWSVTNYQKLLDLVANTTIGGGNASIGGNAAGFTGVLAGDVTGGQSSTTVGALQGNAVLAGTPSDKQVLTWNHAQSRWEAANLPVAGNPDWSDITNKPTSLPPNGNAGGDLAGSTYPNPVIANNAVSGAKIADGGVAFSKIAAGSATGQVLQYDAGLPGWKADKLLYTDIVKSGGGNPWPTTPCTAGKAVVWQSATDGFECAPISITETDPLVKDFAKADPSSDFETTGGVLALKTVPITRGGTGAVSQSGAINNLLPAQGSNAGKLLQTDGTNVTWVDAPASGVTSINGATGAAQTFNVAQGETAPVFKTSGNTHTLNIPEASTSGVAAGTISHTDYQNFSGKQSALGFTPLNPANNLSELSATAATARSNLGLGTAATKAFGTLPGNLVELDGSSRIPASLLPNQSDIYFSQGGNAFGEPAVLGTTDAEPLHLQTGGVNQVTVLSDGNVGIGTSSPSASAVLDLSSTSRGLLLPRMTTAQRNAIVAPAAGLQVYNTSTKRLEYYDGTNWTYSAANHIVRAASNLVQPASGVRNFNTKSLDPLNEFDLTTDRFQPVAAGKYLIVVQLTGESMTDGAHLIASVRKNGIIQDSNYSRASVYTVSAVQLVSIVEMNGTTDYIDIRFDVSAGSVSQSNFTAYPLTAAAANSAGADNLGNHVLAQSLITGSNWISSDGDPEGIRIAADGNVGIGEATPTERLEVAGNIKATQVCLGSDCRATWPTGAAGTVTSIATGGGLTGGPITDNGTISIADGGVTGVKLETISGLSAGAYGSATEIPAITIDTKGRITAISTNTVSALPTPSGVSGKFLKSDGTSWSGQNIQFSDVKNSLGGSAFNLASCGPSKTVAWSSLTDTFSCQDINNLDAGKITTGTLDAARLPSSIANGLWAESSGNVSRSSGSVAIGTAAVPASALLALDSTAKGFLPPRMTSAQRDAISSPAPGLTIYNTTAGRLEVYDGSTWGSASGSSSQEVFQSGSVALNPVTYAWADVLTMTVAAGGKYMILASGQTTSSIPWSYMSSQCTLYRNASPIDTKGFYYGQTSGGSSANFPTSLYSLQTLTTGDIIKVSCMGSSNATSMNANGWKISIVSLGVSNISGADNMGSHNATQNINLGTYQLVGNGGSSGLAITNAGNVGIGTASPDSASILDLNSSTKGFLPPRMTTAQKTSIAAPTAGLMVYDTDLKQVSVYDGTSWTSVPQGTVAFKVEIGSGGSITLGPDADYAPNSVIIDTHNSWNMAGHYFTAPESGYYALGWHFYTGDPVTGSRRVYLYVDTGAGFVGTTVTGDTNATLNASTIVYLAAGHKVKLHVPTGFRLDTYGGGGHNGFWGVKIGAIGGGGGGTSDNLGNHTATQNLKLGSNWLSGDGGNEGIAVDAAGNVGIGTANPTYGLDVEKNVRFMKDSDINDEAGQLRLATKSAPGKALILGYSQSTDAAYIQPVQSGITWAKNLLLSPNGGNVGIGLSNPTHTLHVNGSVAGTSAYVNLSDRSLKREIATVPEALSRVEHLRGVSYLWDREAHPDLNLSDRRELGVVAQEVEAVFPEAVTTDSAGVKSVAYSMLISPLIEAVKELSEKLKALLSRVDSHEMENEALKVENTKLKNELQGMKAYLCSKDPAADFCRSSEY